MESLDRHCSANDVSRLVGSPQETVPPPSSQPATLFLLRDGSEPFHRRIARKLRARALLGYGSGGWKADTLALKLGIGKSQVSRCLSLNERDELLPEYQRALGIAAGVSEVDEWPYEDVLAYVGVAGERRAA